MTMIAQVQTEASSSPTITALTTMSAWRNSATGDMTSVPALTPTTPRTSRPTRVAGAWAEAVEPRAAILVAGRSEGGTTELLGVEAVGGLLRAVAADRERAGYCLGREMVAEAGEIVGHCLIPHSVGPDSRRETLRATWSGSPLQL